MTRLEYWASYFGIPIPEVTKTNYFVVKDTVTAAMTTFANKNLVAMAEKEIKVEANVQKNL